MSEEELTTLLELYKKFLLEQYGVKCLDFWQKCIKCQAYNIKENIEEVLQNLNL